MKLVSAIYLLSSILRIIPMTTDQDVKLNITLSPDAAGKPLQVTITSPWDGAELWSGQLEDAGTFYSDTTIVRSISGLEPRLWSPSDPALYDLKLVCGDYSSTVKVGFRRFEMKDGNFYLNGRKIFLRGNAINPPGRGIPKPLEDSKEFARDYIRFLKGMNINIIRIPDNQDWMEVCDEEGMMIFGGRYGRPTGGTTAGAPKDFDKAISVYKDKDLGDFASHPSVVIYTLSNEMATTGPVGEDYMNFLHKAYLTLKEWDGTREYIGNAGYGMGRAASVYDVHRYWGWYYNSFLTFLNLRDVSMWQNPGRTQAVTFSECVGNYTGIDGRYNLCSRTKQPGSQKCWTGHAPEGEQGALAVEYQAFVLKNVTEMFRRLRPRNPRLSGVMPFTIIFYDWDGVHSFAEMKPKPAAYQYGVSYQPVLLSWEMWQYNAKAGNELTAVAHVVNDDDLGRSLDGARIDWCIESANRHIAASGTIDMPHVDYYGTYECKLSIPLPSDLATGTYTLKGTVIGSDGSVVSENKTSFLAASPEWSAPASPAKAVKVFDPSGKTVTALRKLGFDAVQITADAILNPKKDVLVIGEESWNDSLQPEAFMKKGGRVLCLRQDGAHMDYSWIEPGIKPLHVSNNDPTYLSPEYEYVDGMCINIERPDHPAFAGITRNEMRLWSDYTGFDESQDGFPRIYPVTGGFLAREVDLTRTSLLANYTRNLAAAALLETVHGEGSVILSGFDLIARVGVDPVAEKLLGNLVTYAASGVSPDVMPEVGRCIDWGDYSSENGLVTGAVNGLVVNPYPNVPVSRKDEYPLKVDARGYHYVVSYGGWNTRPGVQYLPRGRRPFAPFDFSLGGNDLVDDEKGASIGEGYFAATAPKGTGTMITTMENNAKESISIGISINGADFDEHVIEPHTTIRVKNAIPSDGKIKVVFKGDRRTVILRTEFE